MNTNFKNSVQIIFSSDKNTLPAIESFAEKFAVSSGFSDNVSSRIAGVASDYIGKILKTGINRTLTLDIINEHGASRMELAFDGAHILPYEHSSISADEIVEISKSGSAKAVLSVFERGELKKISSSNGGDVNWKDMSEEDFPTACSMWENRYGREFFWQELVILGKMQSAVRAGRLLLIGAYDRHNNLFGAVAMAVNSKNTVAEILPPSLDGDDALLKRGLLWLNKKAKYIEPQWLFQYVPGNPITIETPLGNMHPVGIMKHHSFSEPMQIMALTTNSPAMTMYIPPLIAGDFEKICRLLKIRCNIETTYSKVTKTGTIEYALRIIPIAKTAILRIKSYGAKIGGFDSWLVESIRGQLETGIETIYIDLPLDNRTTILIGGNLLKVGFCACGFIYGKYLRLQRIVGKKQGINIKAVPENLEQIVNTMER